MKALQEVGREGRPEEVNLALWPRRSQRLSGKAGDSACFFWSINPQLQVSEMIDKPSCYKLEGGGVGEKVIQ